MVANLGEAMRAVYGEFKEVSKAPVYYDLVYAIFRAQAKNYKLREINDMLDNGSLPLYKGPKRFTSLDAMKNYYYNHRPKVTT
jgi:adenylate cyclase class IV